MLLTACLFAMSVSVQAQSSLAFVTDLEACITNHARRLAETFPSWGDKCVPATEKIDFQAKLYEETLTPIFNQYGYQAALWCSMYSLGMVPIVDSSQPNNPNFDDWFTHLLCPWNFPKECGASDAELSANEEEGVPVCKLGRKLESLKQPMCAPNQHTQYTIFPANNKVKDEPDRRTMSCALCGRLMRTFLMGAPVGAPGNIKAAIGIEYSLQGVPKNRQHMFTAWWDMHPFGAWLANEAAKHMHQSPWSIEELVNNINVWKASNGEEIHGFLWQSLRLLAYDSGTLEGQRATYPDEAKGSTHAFQVCKYSWWLSPQSRDDCAHAAGHGFFYYFLDIGRAVKACWSDQMLHTLPGWEPGTTFNCDYHPRECPRPSAGDLLKWRWLCATGVYHAAGNTLSLEVLDVLRHSRQSAEEFLCKHMNVWGPDDRYFDRCAAGLGMNDAEERLAKVKTGECKPDPDRPPAEWERRQLDQFGHTQQLSCNPASPVTGYPVAAQTCPGGFRAHFPCKPGTLDYGFCIGVWGGTVLNGEQYAFHELCISHAMLRQVFECMKPKPRRPGNLVKYAIDWSETHPDLPLPYNVIDFKLGVPVGVWGGACTCPDGQVYYVGDRGNLCSSISCNGGLNMTGCNRKDGHWAFRLVQCGPPLGGWNRRINRNKEEIVTDGTVGTWGGVCTCPDGEKYLVGDNADQCGSLACGGGCESCDIRITFLWAWLARFHRELTIVAFLLRRSRYL